MAFQFFFSFCLTLPVPEKFKNLIFEIPIITQTLNINNLRTICAKSMNQHTVKNLVERYFKSFVAKVIFTLTVFEILLPEGMSVLVPAQLGTGSQSVKVLVTK